LAEGQNISAEGLSDPRPGVPHSRSARAKVLPAQAASEISLNLRENRTGQNSQAKEKAGERIDTTHDQINLDEKGSMNATNPYFNP
jgi:hypothetical protein